MNTHQFHPDFAIGDAISNEMLNIKNALIELGHTSEIFACHYKNLPKLNVQDYKKYHLFSKSDNILIIHYSIASEGFDDILKYPDKKVLLYHNSTPEHFFDGYSPRHQILLSKADKDLIKSIDRFALILADSEFNSEKLNRLGFKQPTILPYVFNFEKYEILPNEKILKKYKDGYQNILFVGRIVPNKKQDDLIRIFYHYKNHINHQSRLILVGSYLDMEVYYDKLQIMIDELKLKDVVFTGTVDDKDLIAYYKASDIFITMSEHEGFCVPLVEAMYFKTPIIAYNSSAIGETLGEGGLLVSEKNFLQIAELISLVLNDNGLKNKMIQNQSERLDYFNPSRTKEKLKNHLSSI